MLIDSLDGLNPHAARKALAAARNLREGGSLTVIATASHALGGETTLIALDGPLAATGRQPILDLINSATLKLELLVGEDGAEAVTQGARTQALEAGLGRQASRGRRRGPRRARVRARSARRRG